MCVYLGQILDSFVMRPRYRLELVIWFAPNLIADAVAVSIGKIKVLELAPYSWVFLHVHCSGNTPWAVLSYCYESGWQTPPSVAAWSLHRLDSWRRTRSAELAGKMALNTKIVIRLLAGSAAIPFLTGAVASKVGIIALQPMSVFIYRYLEIYWCTLEWIYSLVGMMAATISLWFFVPNDPRKSEWEQLKSSVMGKDYG